MAAASAALGGASAARATPSKGSSTAAKTGSPVAKHDAAGASSSSGNSASPSAQQRARPQRAEAAEWRGSGLKAAVARRSTSPAAGEPRAEIASMALRVEPSLPTTLVG